MKRTLLLLVYLCCGAFCFAQTDPVSQKHPEWSKPYAPFKIVGNLYYVGTYDLACYLIVTPKGNILINMGLASLAPLIEASIEKLGFKLADTKILLTTQAHFDHMGAMAEIKKLTGAKMMVDQADAAVAEDGGRSDYEYNGNISTFKPVKVDRVLHNGDIIELGGMKLTLLHHPGHTRGSCSYVFSVADNKRSYRVLIANMPTIVTDKKFEDVHAYPNIAKDYAYTLNTMRQLKFDIWLASHGSQFDMVKKHKPGSAYHPAAFMDKQNYYKQIAELDKDYKAKIQGK